MDREQLARTCVRIERAGGSVRDYLKGLGFISPWGTWFRLQREELGRDRIHITDGRGNKAMRKITLEDKKQAVEIALKGGNPLKFLKEQCGVSNPSASWAYIKKTLQMIDPDTYDRLTKKEEKPSAVDAVIEELKSAVERPECFEPKVPEVELAEPEEILEKVYKAPVCTAALNYDGFRVRCIENEWGRFNYNAKLELLNWTSPDGEEVSFSPEAWGCFATKILPRAMAILGVSAKI